MAVLNSSQLTRRIAVAALGLFYSVWLSAQSCDLSKIHFVTEHSPPFSYLENGKAAGSAVEVVIALTAAAGCPIKHSDIQVLPWARAYRTALEFDNYAIFSITRTKEREPLFQWVGPISTDTGIYGLIGKKTRKFDLSSVESRNQYSYGVIRDDVGEYYLNDFGIAEKQINLAVQTTSMAKMLQGNRVDLWVYSFTSAKDSLKTIGADVNEFVMVKTFNAHSYYLAFSKNVDPQTIAALQNAHDTLAAKKRATSHP